MTQPHHADGCGLGAKFDAEKDVNSGLTSAGETVEQQAGLQDDYVVFLSMVALSQQHLINPLEEPGFLLFNYHLRAF